MKIKVRAVALTNAIFEMTGAMSGYGSWDRTLSSIKQCIAAGDRFFEEQVPEGFRVFTDSGFSCVVKNRSAWIFCPPPTVRLRSEACR